MTHLLLAILCGSLFCIILKLCQKGDTMQAVFVNYLTAVTATFLPQLISHNFPVNPFAESWIGFSVLQGFFFMAGFLVMSYSISLSGMALTTAASRASLIVPVICGWLLLNQPAPSWIPVILVVVALLMFSLGEKPAMKKGKNAAENKKKFMKKEKNAVEKGKADADNKKSTAGVLFLFVVFLFYGASDFSLKYIQQRISDQYTAAGAEVVDQQLAALAGTIFLMAMLLTLLAILLRSIKQPFRLSWKSVGLGVALGLANLGCTRSVLNGLLTLDTGTFYPLYNVGIILVTTLIGILFFKEKLRPVQYAGLAISILAIVLFFRL